MRSGNVINTLSSKVALDSLSLMIIAHVLFQVRVNWARPARDQWMCDHLNIEISYRVGGGPEKTVVVPGDQTEYKFPAEANQRWTIKLRATNQVGCLVRVQVATKYKHRVPLNNYLWTRKFLGMHFALSGNLLKHQDFLCPLFIIITNSTTLIELHWLNSITNRWERPDGRPNKRSPLDRAAPDRSETFASRLFRRMRYPWFLSNIS